VVGAPDFVPGVSIPDIYILNKGTADGVKEGSAIVIGNNLVGVVSKLQYIFLKPIWSTIPRFPLQPNTGGAVGVIKNAGTITLDNILLLENVSVGSLS